MSAVTEMTNVYFRTKTYTSKMFKITMSLSYCLSIIVSQFGMDENHLDVNWRDDQGNTLLHFSVQADDEERVRYLLAKGARVNDNNYKGETPLDHANFGNPKMVKLLLDGIENVNPKPLQLAVLAGSLESVTLILNTPRVSRYLCYEDYRSKTALDYAIEAGYFEIAQVLLQNVAQQNQFLYFKE